MIIIDNTGGVTGDSLVWPDQFFLLHGRNIPRKRKNWSAWPRETGGGGGGGGGRLAPMSFILCSLAAFCKN